MLILEVRILRRTHQATCAMISLATIDQYASQVAGTPVAIVCSTKMTPGDYGAVYFSADGSPQPTIYLRKSMCNDLRHADRDRRITSDTSLAMLALTHECEHIALRSQDETLVERTAIRNRWQMVKLFKLPSSIARYLMGGMVDQDAALPAVYHEGQED